MSSNYDAINQPLLRRIPVECRRVLDVGCDTGLLGEAIKARNPEAHVVGIEVNGASARYAKQRLDEVYVLNIESDDLTILEAEYDAIVFGDTLEHLYDPEATLRRMRALLSPAGKIYACIPNVQHHSILRSLLRGDFQYQKLGLLDRTHIRFYTLANIMKLFLDGGFLPVKRGRLTNEPNELSIKLGELSKDLGYSELNQSNFDTFQYLVEASPLAEPDPEAQPSPATFVICSNDNDVLASNVKGSPVLNNGLHQIIVKRGMASAAEGYNAGLSEAKNDIVVFMHHDVYLPQGWDRWLAHQVRRVCALGNPDWVLGCVGAAPMDGGKRRVSGLVVDRDETFVRTDSDELIEVQTLDELLLVMPATTPLRFDPGMGFHFYGADICLQNTARGGKNYAAYMPCYHNSQLFGTNAPRGFNGSQKFFRSKWRDVPYITTTCARLGP